METRLIEKRSPQESRLWTLVRMALSWSSKVFSRSVLLNLMQRCLVSMIVSIVIANMTPLCPARAQSLMHPIRIVDFDWTDTARARSVPARLHWPADIGPGARVPLIVFSHGIGGSRRGYSYLGQYWATRGVASLHVQHVGSDSSLWAGNPFTLVGRLQLAAHESEAIARGLDMGFALDRVLSRGAGNYGAQIDPKRIVAAGHSYGANTALIAIGAGVMRGGKWIEAGDKRFSAAIVISAPPFYGESDLASVLHNVTVPSLHVTATDDVIKIPGYYSSPTDRLDIYNAIATQRKVLAVFQGGSHSIFTDRPSTGGSALNPKVKSATAELALAFLDLTFDKNQTSMTKWNTKWQPIVALAPGASPRVTHVAHSRRIAREATNNFAVSP